MCIYRFFGGGGIFHNKNNLRFGLVVFNGISTLLGYSILNPVYKQIVCKLINF